MAKEKILLVEDAEDILELVRYHLAKEGYQVSCARSGEEALNAVRQTSFDLILLDLMLPGLDGLEVCRRLRRDAAMAHVPVIMLTAKSEETDMVVGLELGADDYVTKPFSPRVLTARIRAALRRAQQKDDGEQADILSIGALQIDRSRYEVCVKGELVRLTATEFGILLCLTKRPGWVFSRYQIVEAVRGEDYSVTDRAVDVQIVGLRKKLGELGHYIETVRGVGYRFQAQAEA
ncbi:response regulator transcription factor [Candidatus Electronema sp. PJ]|uniref:response regulator transcription factor n=1 Tax=Candidatus Electronema sp. PJ TaxID=3401572 RepID=UPI003AA8F4B8